jgi:molecular chaperone GrpE
MKISKKKITDKPEVENEEIKNLKIQLARALADYDNLKKRVEAEKSVWFQVAGARIVGRFLSVLDNLENAQKHVNDQGLAIVINEFRRVISEEGFEEIQIKLGETEFNSETMEAVEVTEVAESDKNNKIAEIALAGWQTKEGLTEKRMVIRPAKVKVFKTKVEN